MTSDSDPPTRLAEPLAGKPCIFTIINPVSCANGSELMRAAVEAALERRGLTSEYAETSESETALPLAANAVARGTDLILAVGGDGTIMESINAVIGKDIPVGIIPAGTGNLLATNLGIPLTLDDAVAVAITGRKRALDLVRVNHGSKYFAIMGGLGYDAIIMRETPRAIKRQIGRLSYLWTGLREATSRRFHARVCIDDQPPFDVRAKSLLIANMGSLGGVSLFPESDPTDGIIELGILQAQSLPALCVLVWHMLRGKPQASPGFDIYKARKISIHTLRPVPHEFDGDDEGDTRALEAEVVPKAAYVMVPDFDN